MDIMCASYSSHFFDQKKLLSSSSTITPSPSTNLWGSDAFLVLEFCLKTFPVVLLYYLNCYMSNFVLVKTHDLH